MHLECVHLRFAGLISAQLDKGGSKANLFIYLYLFSSSIIHRYVWGFNVNQTNQRGCYSLLKPGAYPQGTCLIGTGMLPLNKCTGV